MADAPFRRLPLPLKLLLIGIGVLIVLSIAPSVSGLLGIAAVILWALAIVGLLQAADLLPEPLRQGFVGRIGRSLVLGAQPTLRHIDSPLSGSSASEDKAADRPSVVARATATLRTMRGQDAARSEILDRIVPRASALGAKGRRLLGASRALVYLISGPPGVGKSTVAESLADLLYGLDALAIPKRIRIEQPPGGRIDLDWRDRLQDSLDGIVLIDNANWLAESNPLTNVVYADALCAAVIEIGERYQGRLAVILTMGDAALAQIANRPSLRQVARRLTLRQLAMDPIPVAVLIELLRDALRSKDIELPAALNDQALRLIKRLADTEHHDQAFDYAEAMRRAAERIEERLSAVGGRHATADDLQDALDPDD